MAVVAVFEAFRAAQKLDRDDRGVVKRTRAFIVRVEARTDDPSLVEAASGIPAIGELYPVYNDCWVRKRDIERFEDHPEVWRVSVEYSNERSGKDEEKNKDADEDRYPKIRGGSNRHRIALDKDAVGDALVNTAGDRFDPPIEIDVVHPTVTVTVKRPTATNILQLQTANQGKVNETEMFGFDPGYVMCTDIQWQELVNKTATFLEVTFVFEVNPKGWNPLFVLNQGMAELVSGVRQIICDPRDETPFSGPTLLQRNGLAMEPGGSPEFLEFYPYETANLAGLIPEALS